MLLRPYVLRRLANVIVPRQQVHRAPKITRVAIEPTRLAQLDYLQLVVLDWETPAGTEDSGFPLLPAPKRACLGNSLS